MLIDTHVHLDSFSDDEIAAILGRSREAGVGFVICAGTTVASSIRSVALSRVYSSFSVSYTHLTLPTNREV